MSAGIDSPAGAQLRRWARESAKPGLVAPGDSRCDLCAEPLNERHRHLLEAASESLVCACQACSVLFDHPQAGQYRAIRSRPRRLSGLRIDDVQWASLGIPIGLAFFVRREESAEVTAFYPNPLGMMRSVPDQRAWDQLVSDNPEVSGMDSDVEALLINRVSSESGNWLLPIDACYRLVAVVRQHWRGFSGGNAVWRFLDEFFVELDNGDRGRS